jgi:hypothetical protein
MQTSVSLQLPPVGTKRIQLSANLTEFPSELYAHCDTVEILDLSNNKLRSLPDDFHRFHRLKIAFFSQNEFTELPAVLGKCASLTMIGFKSNKIETVHEDALQPQTQWLILTDNRLKSLPESIGKCIRLQKCALAGNQLTQLPDSMQDCVNLELLRISANEIAVLPPWLLNLPKLSWLAFSGNPALTIPSAPTDTTLIPWDSLEFESQIGEGASGIISKGIWKTDIVRPIAIKVFKGEVTSDGYPQDELQTCLLTGKHQYLVPLLGQITASPNGETGIVMDLISSAYTNLGNPPSLNTCTRDTFPTGFELTQQQAVSIATAIAKAMEHLHKQGIMHGDLYAHNTLFNTEGDALLGDFGAATYYGKNHLQANYFEALDVRAFGCMLDDLMRHTSNLDSTNKQEFEKIIQSCWQTNVLERPSFGDLLILIERL